MDKSSEEIAKEIIDAAPQWIKEIVFRDRQVAPITHLRLVKPEDDNG